LTLGGYVGRASLLGNAVLGTLGQIPL
jgi:hypothetical protein